MLIDKTTFLGIFYTVFILSPFQKLYLFILLFIVINVNSFFVHAVDFVNVGPPFINIEKKPGENLANATALIQDTQGFIWLINDTGLLRYDGNEYKLFPGLEQFTSSNADNLVEGEAGRLWIGTLDKGLALFDPKTTKLTFYDLTDTFDINTNTEGKTAQVNMLTYQNQHLYLASKNQVVKINEQDLTLVENYIFPIAETDTIARFLVTSTGDIWCSTSQGNGVLRLNDEGITRFEHHPNNITSISGTFVASIYEDSQKRIWFGGIAGLDLFLPQSNTFLRFSPLDLSNAANKNKGDLANFVLTISEDKEQNLWLSLMGSGVVKFLPDSKTFEHYPHINGVSSTILTDSMYGGASFDNRQTLWVSTKKGLSKLPNNNRKVTQLINVDKDNCKALAMQENKQGLLFSCDKTLYQLHNNKITLIENFDKKIVSIVQEAERFIWLGTIGGGVYRYNLDKGTSKHYGFTSDVNEHMGVNLIHQLRADINGDIYGLAMKHTQKKGAGLLRYNPSRDEFSNFATELELGNWIDINKNKLILIGAFSNLPERLYWFDKNNQIIKKIPIKTGRVLAIVKWQQQLWVSTEELGLITIDIETGQWQKLADNSNGIITGFYQDASAENLYFSLNKQLYKFGSVIEGNIQTHCISCSLEIDSPTMNDGQFGQLINAYSILTESNRFFISSENRLLSFAIDQLENPQLKSQLLLTDYKVMGKSAVPDEQNENALLSKSIERTRHIKIPPETTFFSLSFSKVGASKPEQIKYAYKMEGLNTDWINAKASHAQADYSLLPAGSYTFQVKASNDNGEWENDTDHLSLGITVLPPWWKTWWAYSLYLGFIISILGLFYRTKIAEKERESSLELVKAKEQLFANISHEFRTPLTLILGPAKVIKQSSNDDNIQHNASLIERNSLRLLSMVDQLLQLAQLNKPETKVIATQKVSDVCNFVLQTFTVIAQEKKIDLTMKGNFDDSWWVSAEQDALETILYNLLTNAIKFTQDNGTISVEIISKGQYLEFNVTDSGCGIAEHNHSAIFDRFTRIENKDYYVPGAGIGLALVKGLVNLLGGTISLSSRVNEGSSFVFTLPKAQASSCNNLTSSTGNKNIQRQKHLATELSNINSTSGELKENVNEDHSKPQVLIVDDNQEIREFIKVHLSDTYSIIEAENGQQALDKALKHSPDIIITDVMMPIMNGFELLDAIRNEMAISHIPVILLTAKDDPQSKLKGLSDLADDYITKPFDGQELLIRMQGLLGIRSILQKRFNHTDFTSVAEDIVPIVSDDTVLNKADELSAVEQRFILRFKEFIEQGYTNPELTLPMISGQLAMSERQLQRKLKAISGTSFSEMLREFRLMRGHQLLNDGEQIAIIADQVGFTSSSYFVRCFKAKYGKTPNDYRKAS